MVERNGGGGEQNLSQQRGMQQRDASHSQISQGGQIQYYGDREWHRGTDAWGNPVWYRAFGWSYSGGDPESRADQEPHEHGRTASRHYQRSNERVRDDVYDRLNDHRNVDSSDIEVRADNGNVTLEGTVHDRREKRLAEDIAESVSGVHDVQNNLRVESPQNDARENGKATPNEHATPSNRERAGASRN